MLRPRSAHIGFVTGLLVILAALTASAQLPDTVETRGVEIWSDGTRLAGDLFWPKSWKQGEKLPAIVVCGGWGSVKSHLNRAYGPTFAAEGYFVLTFDYRGWGESDGRLVAEGEIPEPGSDGVVTIQVREIRDMVSPVERIEDIRAAISWLELEPGVDRNRIGLWGTSFGGGNVVAVAAIDRRVKCVVSQVGDLNSRWGWVNGVRQLLTMLPKAKGTPEELADRYDEAVLGMAERAGRIEELMRELRITLSPTGMLAVAETARDDGDVVALVDGQNKDLQRFLSIIANSPDRADEIFFTQRAQRARGLIAPFPQGEGIGTAPPMTGIADLSQMVEYAAVDLVDDVNVPVLIIDAGNEELMDTSQGSAVLAKKLGARGVPVKREVFDGVSHFEIYRPPALQRANDLAIVWYNKHLKSGPDEEEKTQ